MQAQDPRSMRWAVTMRTRKSSFKAFGKAFDEGRLIRAHLLRCTWQLVAAEDYHWIRQVIYDKGLSVMNGWTSALGFKFTGQEKERALGIIEEVLERQHVATEEEMDTALLRAGIPKNHLVYSHHLRMAELEGLICSGPLGPKNTYMLTRERIGANPGFDRDEALGLLAARYFRSHGPATTEDFVWWSGLNVGDCKRGMAVCGRSLEPCRQNGRVFYLHEESRKRGYRNGNVLLLPSYDEYLIGYKSRDVVLHPDHAHHAHDKKGIFRHVVALDGEIVGNWHPSAKDGGVSVFKEGVTLPEDSLRKSWDRFYAARN